MKTIFSPSQLLHNPKHEISDGALKPAVEIPSRAEIVHKQLLAQKLGPVTAPNDFGLEPLARVHERDYLAFLQDFWMRWIDEGRIGEEAFPFVWPVRGLRHEPSPLHIDGLLGRYSFDAGTPLGAHTFEAAQASAHTALSGAQLIANGERAAFALCRPPGHHAARDYYGGYCFINNAAVAGQWLLDEGASRVAILDVDYHHGNGTQDIFYRRSDVLFASLHADPREEYPYYLGHSDEIGEGPGEGMNLNYPIPIGADWALWSVAFENSLERIAAFSPDVVVVSLGLDTYEKDPISRFKFKQDDFLKLGARLARLGAPVLFVMEGGYAVEALGTNCVNVLIGYENG